MVLAGHVHDYQRLTKTQKDGTQVPYLVAGMAAITICTAL